jgi:micrococcal nuclease
MAGARARLVVTVSLLLAVVAAACAGAASGTPAPKPSPAASTEASPAPTVAAEASPTPPPAMPAASGQDGPAPQGRQSARVVRVVDGDTIDVDLAGATVRVRYIGMDTPETVDPRRPVGCFGAEAAARNRALVEGREVELEKDVSETDSFGRLLRYVYVDGVMVNEALVREGYAQVATYPPDVKYVDRLLAAQREAQAARRGLWSACAAPTPTVAPAARSSCPQGCTVPPAGCVIKGNISQSTGEKIYHVPGGDFYDQTVIDPARGERWFCTEAEAVANGWRKSAR